MTEKQESAEVADTDALSAEEQAFFESGGEKEITENEENDDGRQKEAQTEADEAETGLLDKKEQARDEKGKFVPHQALHAEREEHKKTRSELQELKEFRARMEERMSWFEKAAPKEEAKDETPPDPNEDVFAALKWTQDKLLASERQQHEARTQQEQHQREQQHDQSVWTHWDNSAREYAKENPDFGNAAKFLAETRDKQLTALSIADPRFSDVRARNAQIEAELKQIVVAAAQKQMSPAEAVYQIAQSYGYTPQQAAEAAEQAGGNNELVDKLKRLESAQNGSRTVGNAPGSAGGDEITAESLASMPEDEFNRWVAVPENARRFEKLMGG